jgi:hypothetical protein
MRYCDKLLLAPTQYLLNFFFGLNVSMIRIQGNERALSNPMMRFVHLLLVELHSK